MALFSTKLEVLTLVWVNESKAVNYVDISKAAFWSSQSFIDDFYQSNTLQCRINAEVLINVGVGNSSVKN